MRIDFTFVTTMTFVCLSAIFVGIFCAYQRFH